MKSLFLILALSLSVCAQTQELKDKTKLFKNHKRFLIEYDKFKDRTYLRVGPFAVKDRARSGIVGVSASAHFKGDSPPKNLDSVYLHFEGYGLRYSDSMLYGFIDGERLEFGKGDQLSSGIYSGRASMMFSVPLEVFQKLSNAKTVELQVGSAELRLEDEHFQAFKDFLSLTQN